MDINDLELAELLPWIIAAVVVIAIVLIVIAVMKRRKRQERSDRLRERFGPEYDRTVERADSRSDAEDQLEARAERRERIRLRSLSPDERRSFVARWEDLQASFVDGPSSAVRGADVLLDDVALARGYPDASAEHRLDDLAMDHSDEVHEYRKANHGEQGDDRGALLAARGLFEALIGSEPETHSERAPDAPFDSDRTMSGREPHDDDTRTPDTRDDGERDDHRHEERRDDGRGDDDRGDRRDEVRRDDGRGDDDRGDRRDEVRREDDRGDEVRDDEARAVDAGGGGSTRVDERAGSVTSDRAPSERTQPLPGDQREANQRSIDGDDTSVRDLPPKTEERTIPPPPESR